MRVLLLKARAVMISIVWIVLAPSLSAQDAISHPRTISVTGTAEIRVAPDEVTLTLGVESRDKDLTVAKIENDKRFRKLMSLTRAAGVDAKDVETSALTMGPEYSEERIPKLLGYVVSQVVTVTLRDLSKYDALMTGSLEAGVNRVHGVSFLVAAPQKYREQARLKAVQSARDKAIAMATQLGQSIGKPWEVMEEPDYDCGVLTRANYIGSLPERGGPTVAGGQVVIRASVRVIFQLE
jgi:uncharacterized protein YggE